jgi:hypothetical protein
LKALAVAAPSDLTLKDYLERAGRSMNSHCSLLIITANAEVEWTASVLPLMWRGIMPTVCLLDPLSFGTRADTRGISEVFQSLSVPCHIIPRALLDKPQARPGHEGEWEWHISATGKAVALRQAHEDWRGLG